MGQLDLSDFELGGLDDDGIGVEELEDGEAPQSLDSLVDDGIDEFNGDTFGAGPDFENATTADVDGDVIANLSSSKVGMSSLTSSSTNLAPDGVKYEAESGTGFMSKLAALSLSASLNKGSTTGITASASAVDVKSLQTSELRSPPAQSRPAAPVSIPFAFPRDTHLPTAPATHTPRIQPVTLTNEPHQQSTLHTKSGSIKILQRPVTIPGTDTNPPLPTQNQHQYYQPYSQQFNPPAHTEAQYKQEYQPIHQVPRGQMMSASNVRYIISKVLQPLESPDPFSEDFYYLQLCRKREAKALELARQGLGPPPVPFVVPLPTWRDTKERIQNQLLESSRELIKRTKDFAEREQTLGLLTRSSIARPREQLSLPAGWQDDVDSSGGAPFSTRLWAVRRAVQRGHEALHTVLELEHLLRLPLIAGHPEARAEVLAEVEEAVKLLAMHLGVLLMGGLAHMPGQELPIDGAQVSALLQTPKGRKLLARGLPHLPPEPRWALASPVLTRLLQMPLEIQSTGLGAASTSTPAEGTQSETQLMEALQNIFRQTHMNALHIRSQQYADPPQHQQAMTAVEELLSRLKRCVQSIVVAFLGRRGLRQALFTECDPATGAEKNSTDMEPAKTQSPRLQLLRSLVHAGDSVASLLDPVNSDKHSSIDKDSLGISFTGTNSLTKPWIGPNPSNSSTERVNEWQQTKDTLLRLIEADSAGANGAGN